MITGIIFVAIGVAFLLENLGIYIGIKWGIVWPLILIMIGLHLVIKKKPW
jgi:hypothetical protein